jgi:hypothetical protein
MFGWGIGAGVVGVLAVVAIYYLWARKLTPKTAEPGKPQDARS